MDIDVVKAFIRAVGDAPISELDYREGPVHLRLVKGDPRPLTTRAPSAVAALVEDKPDALAPAAQGDRLGIEAPLPGVFHRSPGPGEPPFVTLGETVEEGRTLGVIEAMKMLTPIKARRAGVLSAICVEDGESVEADALLFEIE